MKKKNSATRWTQRRRRSTYPLINLQKPTNSEAATKSTQPPWPSPSILILSNPKAGLNLQQHKKEKSPIKKKKFNKGTEIAEFPRP